VQLEGAAIHLVARDEFDQGVVGVLRFMALDGEAEPARPRFRVELQRGGAGGRVPGGEQVGFVAQHVGGIARAHQRLGRGRGGFAGEAGTAAGGERLAAAAGAGRRGSVASRRHRRLQNL